VSSRQALRGAMFMLHRQAAPRRPAARRVRSSKRAQRKVQAARSLKKGERSP